MKDNKKKNIFDWNNADANRMLEEDWDLKIPTSSSSTSIKSMSSKQRTSVDSSESLRISLQSSDSTQNFSLASTLKSNIKESTFKILSENLKIMSSSNSNDDLFFMQSKMIPINLKFTCTVKKLSDKTVTSSSVTDISVFLKQSKFYDLHDVKQLESKRKLLEAASLTNSFKLLITVIQHLRYTLRPPLFVSLLKSVPKALCNFVYFVKKCNIELSQSEIESFECVNTYMLDTIMSKFIDLVCQQDSKDLHEKLEVLVKTTQKHLHLNSINQTIRDFLSLAVIQTTTKSKMDDMVNNLKSFLSDKECKIPFPIFVKQNFMDTICFIVSQEVYRNVDYESKKSLHKISDKQFEWILVRVFVKLKKWDILRNVLVSKHNIFKTGKPSSLIGFEFVLNHLIEASDVPDEEVRYYFKNVPEGLKPFIKDILKIP